MTTENEHQSIQDLLLENQRLLTENNQLIKKMDRRAVWVFWIRIFWLLVLLGAPFAFYYYIFQPYFEAVHESFGTFNEGLEHVPGWSQFRDSVISHTEG